MPKLPELITPRLTVRLANQGDVPFILRYVLENRAHLEPWEPLRSAEYYTEDQWCRQVAFDEREYCADRCLRMYAFPRTGAFRVIGSCNFNTILRGAAHHCTLGYSLSEAEQGLGYMTEALGAGIEYMFTQMHIHRIRADYMPHNRKSAAVLKRLGFTVEGYARDHLQINGEWQDHILTALVNPKWTPRMALGV